MSDTKPIVQYRREDGFFINVGKCAYVTPIDHPNHLEAHSVTNGREVRTSTVLSYNKETGEFETRNTKYVPAPESHE